MTRLNGKSALTPNPAPATEAGEITCARTHDADTLRQFYLNNIIWEPMQCDGAVQADELDYEALVGDGLGDALIFVTSSYAGEIAGLFMFDRINPHCYEIHSALLPEFWGKGIASNLGLEACRWMVEHTGCKKIITSVPDYNDPAYKMAMSAGMMLEGCNRKSFMKGGVLHDQAIFGFTKEELLCQ